jgi:hypothetical protein
LLYPSTVGRNSRVKRLRRAEREGLRLQAEASRLLSEERGCLFCRLSDGGFTSKEHVFPESLGNTELILPPGVVCDRCNNQVLSALDQTLCDFMPFSLMRTIRGIPSKSGKLPRFRAGQGTIDHVPSVGGADPTLVFQPNGREQMLREVERFPDGRVRLEFKGGGGKRMTARYAAELSRALLKSGLECAWLDHGEMMLESRFDHIREAVLGSPRNGLFALETRTNPESPQSELTYKLLPYEVGWRMLVSVQYQGIAIGTDSRLPGPVATLPDELVNIVTFTTSDFRAA